MKIKLKIEYWSFWVLQIIRRITWRITCLELLNNFDLGDMESSHSGSSESDIEEKYSCFKKRSIAGGKQTSSKKQKRYDSESKRCYFFTLPSILHYFLMFKVVKNNSVQNVKTISFCYVFLSLFFCRYLATTYFYRPFSLFSYEKFWFKFSQKNPHILGLFFKNFQFSFQVGVVVVRECLWLEIG